MFDSLTTNGVKYINSIKCKMGTVADIDDTRSDLDSIY